MLLTLVVCAAAAAEPVQEFGFQIRDVTPDGHYGVVFSSNSYDTTGDQPPALVSNSVRFAAGISFLPQFLRRSALCDAQKLRDTLRQFPEPKVLYGDQVKHLPATLQRLRSKLRPAQLRLLRTCVAAREGTGRVTVDARPFFTDPIPADLYLFLSTPTVKGAFASFGVLVVPDRSSPVVRDSTLLQDQRFVVAANLFNDPSPDGVYGYRLLLPPGQHRRPEVQRRGAARRQPGDDTRRADGQVPAAPPRALRAPEGHEEDPLVGDAPDLSRLRAPAVRGDVRVRDRAHHHEAAQGALPALPAVSRRIPSTHA